MLVGYFRCCLNVFDETEKIGRLDDNSRRLLVQLTFEIRQIGLSRLIHILKFRHRHALMLGIRSQDVPIFRMHGT